VSRIDDLRRLQGADEHIETLRSEIVAVESALSSDAELERRRTLAAAAGAAHAGADAAAASAEAELDKLQRRVRDLDRRLYGGSVHNPNELLEMQHELETLRVRKAEAEETTMALLEAAEAASGEELSASTALSVRDAQRADELGPLEERYATLRAALDEALQQRETAAAGIGAADLALYSRVAARRHPAVVPLVGDSCGGCHLPISIEERRAVRTSAGIVQCPNCDRILTP
jgi:predicted  nucleic acid-binding Zn-ribbon protein